MRDRRFTTGEVVRKAVVALAIFAGVLGVGGDTVSAAPSTRAWTGGGANNSWMTAANWDTGAPVAGDHLVFPPNAARKANSNNFPNFTAFESISFLGSGYTISGNRVVVNFEVLNLGDGTNTISLILDGAADLKQLAGTLNLNGANSHSGTNYINGGRVNAGHNNAFGEFGSLVDHLGGTVAVADGVTIQNRLLVGGPSVPIVLGLGASEWAGPIDVADDTEFEAGPGATFEVSAPVKGVSNWYKSGLGTLVLSEANTFTGAVEVREGTLRVTREDAFGASFNGVNVLPGATLALAGADAFSEPIVIAGDGFAGLGALRSMAGIVHVADLTTADDATIRVDAGTLRLPNGIDHQLGTNFVTKSGPGTLEIEGNGGYSENLVVTGGTLSVRGTLLADVEVQAGVLTGSGALGRLDVIGGRVEPGVGGNGTLKVNGVAYLGPASTASFRVDAPNDYAQLWVTGTVILDNGALEVTGDGDVSAGGGVTLIRNDSAQPVNGRFSGRQEGNTAAIGAADFRLTYFAGQMPLNDVELMSLGGAEPADTGVQIGNVAPVLAAGSEVAISYLAYSRGIADVPGAELRLSVPAGLGFIGIAAQPGWSCLTPIAGQPGTVVCTNASWPTTFETAGIPFVLTLKVLAPPNTALVLNATLEHDGDEGNEVDNSATRDVSVGAADPRPFKLRILVAARD